MNTAYNELKVHYDQINLENKQHIVVSKFNIYI